ncbi:MAG: hypothetical protein WC830_17940 [Burkholderiales bacterium]|jgi:hypothetical protein
MAFEVHFTNAAAVRKTYCALRAPTVFSVRIKSIRTENTVMDKSKGSVGFYTTSQLCNNGGVI